MNANQATEPDDFDIGPFLMRVHSQIVLADYQLCSRADPQGIALLEELTGRPLYAFRTWAHVVNRIADMANTGVLLRLHILYAHYMLAKIRRVTRGQLTDNEKITLGFNYYTHQLTERANLLHRWVEHHPEDRYLLPAMSEPPNPSTQHGPLLLAFL